MGWNSMSIVMMEEGSRFENPALESHRGFSIKCFQISGVPSTACSLQEGMAEGHGCVVEVSIHPRFYYITLCTVTK